MWDALKEESDGAAAASGVVTISVDEPCCICLEPLQSVERAQRNEALSVYDCKHALHQHCARQVVTQLLHVEAGSVPGQEVTSTHGITALDLEFGMVGLTCPLCRTRSRKFTDVPIRAVKVVQRKKKIPPEGLVT